MAAPRCSAILVVEDEPDIRHVIAAFLDVEGFQVYEAENGKMALEVLGGLEQPTLILADMMMPVMDGRALIAALRNDDRLATLPVVIVTAADVTAPHGYRRLKKPIDLDDLLQIVKEMCSPRA